MMCVWGEDMGRWKTKMGKKNFPFGTLFIIIPIVTIIIDYYY